MLKHFIRNESTVTVFFVETSDPLTYRTNLLKWFSNFDDAVGDELAVLAAGNYLFRSELTGTWFWVQEDGMFHQQWTSKPLVFPVVEDALDLVQLLKSYGFTPWKSQE